MADPGKELPLEVILTLLALCIGISQANMANGCPEDGIDEAINLAQPHDTIEGVSLSNNKSLTCNQASALHDIIYKTDESYIVDGKRLEADELIRAELGQPFNISLESNPTTGYIWTVDFDNKFLSGGAEIDGTINTVRPALMGSGGRQIFSFTPIREGQTIVSAVYKRSWEEAAADNRMFLIIIQPSGS